MSLQPKYSRYLKQVNYDSHSRHGLTLPASDKIFCSFGDPSMLQSDHGGEFKNKITCHIREGVE